MARTPKDLVSAKALGKVFTAAHKRAGSPGFEQISRRIFANSGEEISGEQVRKIHKGLVDPATMDINDLVALCNYYSLPLSKLPTVAHDRLERTSTLLASSLRWITTCDGQLGLAFPREHAAA